MSEHNPFAAVEEGAEPTARTTEEAGTRKKLLLVGAVAALALGAGAFVFLSGGEDGAELSPVARAPLGSAALPSPAASAARQLPPTTQLTLGRNPFRALYVQPAGGGGTDSGTTSGGTAPITTTGGTTPVVIVDSGAAPAPGSGPAPAPAPAQPAPAQPTPAQQPAPRPATQSTVSLEGVTAGKDGTNPTGSFVYDGQEVTGAPGDVMAGKLLVISLQQDATGGWFANLQLGDGSPFEVHENQTVVVQ